jgi:hypothetical protein
MAPAITDEYRGSGHSTGAHLEREGFERRCRACVTVACLRRTYAAGASSLLPPKEPAERERHRVERPELLLRR